MTHTHTNVRQKDREVKLNDKLEVIIYKTQSAKIKYNNNSK